MATLTVQPINRAGLVSPGYAAASGGGDNFLPGDQTFLHVYNNSGSPITVTVVTPGTALPNLTVDDVAVSVPAAGDRLIGPFPPPQFADPTDGLADITYSSAASVVVAVLSLTQP